jgi:putative transposase
MEQQTVPKTCKYQLMPTPTQERELGDVLGFCRWLYTTALEQRIIAYRRAGVSLSRYSQEAELKDLRAVMPEDAALHRHMLHDGLARLDHTSQEDGDGATGDKDFLVLAKSGRGAVRWSRPVEGTPKTVTISTEADGWSVCFSGADAPIQPLPYTGQDTGADLGVEAFATLASGARLVHPGWTCQAERALKAVQRRVSRRKKRSARRRKAVILLAKAHQQVHRRRQDDHHQTALALVRGHDVLSPEDLPAANLLKNHHLAKSIRDAGRSQVLGIVAFKAAFWSPKAGLFAGARAQRVARACIGTTTRRRTESGSGRAVGEGLGYRPRRTENPSGGSPRGVSKGGRLACEQTGV